MAAPAPYAGVAVLAVMEGVKVHMVIRITSWPAVQFHIGCSVKDTRCMFSGKVCLLIVGFDRRYTCMTRFLTNSHEADSGKDSFLGWEQSCWRSEVESAE